MTPLLISLVLIFVGINILLKLISIEREPTHKQKEQSESWKNTLLEPKSNDSILEELESKESQVFFERDI